MRARTILATLVLAALGAAALTAQDPIDKAATSVPSSAQVLTDLEQAKLYTNQKRYAEAIAKAEAAIAKLRILAQPRVETRDLTILTVFGDGDAGVTVVIKNMGTAPSPAPVMLFMIPAGGGSPVPLTTVSVPLSLPTPLGAGETRTVKSRAFGCGTTQRVKAKIDPNNGVAETNEQNNESQVIEVRSRPCGS